MRWALRGGIAAAVLGGCSYLAFANDAAHRMAQGFAAEAQSTSAARDRPASEPKSPAAPQAAAPKPDDTARRQADEADMLARARAEAEERRRAMLAAEETAPAAAPPIEQPAKAEAPPSPDSAPVPKAQPPVMSAEAERRIAEAEERAARREAELAALREEIARQPVAPAAAAAAPADPAPPVSDVGNAPSRNAPPATPVPPSTRVTLLLAMEPGDRGIRRLEKSADPVVCLANRCMIGAGADRPAREVTRWGALGTGNTLGARAGACSHALTCVFRYVDLGAASAAVQPIDLRIMRHDRREERVVTADTTCAVTGGRLTCRQPVVSADYRLWVIPEAVASEAGPAALEAAVRAWLPDGRTAEKR
jgi:colicin import membrane protein